MNLEDGHSTALSATVISLMTKTILDDLANMPLKAWGN